MSISGTNALVGAYLDNEAFSDQGSVYFFGALDTVPTETAKRTASSDAATNAYFGGSVSLDNTSGLVGAFGKDNQRGAAYFFTNVATSTPVKLTASDGVASGGPSSPIDGDFFGISVSLAGTTALVGAFSDDIGANTSQGSAYLFRNLNAATGSVTQDAKLIASDGGFGDAFGISVSLSGNNGLVGASGNNAQGAAYLFNNLSSASGSISENFKLTALDGASGDQFGYSVSLSGNSALVGARQKSGAGAAYFFPAATNNMVQTKLLAFDSASGDGFGTSVSLSGSGALVGAPGDDGSSGAVYLFPDPTNSAAQVKIVASTRTQLANFGGSVSIDGDLFVIGAYLADGPAALSGKAYSGSVSSVTTLDGGSASRTIDGISFVSRVDWVIGDTTDGNHVTLKQGNSADVTTADKGVYIGRNAGSDNNSLIVQGTVTATTVNISSPSGSTGNTLRIDDTGKVSAATIAVNNGGTLLLHGTTGNYRIGNTTSITLANGGKLATSGLSEGSSAPGSPPGIGALTLQGGSTIDFAAGQNGSTLLAASGITSGSGVISVLYWSGSANMDNGAAGNDRLLFVADPMFSSAQLAQFQFYDDNNISFASGATQVIYNGFYEIVPVPEPTTWLAGALIAGLLGVTRARQPRRGNGD